MPRWKWLAVSVSAALVILGGVAFLLEDESAPAPGTAGSQQTTGAGRAGSLDDAGGAGFVEGFPRSGQEPGSGEPGTDESGDGAWSAGMFRLGFSFFAGACIGYAVRKFLKLSMLVTGILLLAIFGLSYSGLVTVDWKSIDEIFRDLVSRIGDESGRFRTFITGSLPSAAMAGLGLVVGFKKN
jgi:uncharacterized membrane protein (Fun14 family)